MIEIIGHILNGLAFVGAALVLLPFASLLTRSDRLAGLTARLSCVFERLISAIAHIIMWAGLAMMLIQVLSVLLRYVFGINFIWMQESIIYLFALLFLLGAGYALIKDEHVRVDVVYTTLSPRKKAMVNMLGTYLFLFPVCGLIIWAAGGYVAAAWLNQEGSQDASGIQAVFLLKSLIPAFATLLAMAGFVVAAKASAVLTCAKPSGAS